MSIKSNDNNKTTVVLKAGKASDGKNNPSGASEHIDESSKMRSALVSILKIVITAALADDEIASDFFAEYDNYNSISSKLRDMKLLDGSNIATRDDFEKSPNNCWMKIIAAVFSALYAFPDHCGICHDVIVTSKVENDAMGRPLGNCYSLMIRLEALDWKEHLVNLYLPFEKGAMILIVDNEPLLYASM